MYLQLIRQMEQYMEIAQILNSYKNIESKNVKIETNNLEMYYKDGSSYEVKLVDYNNQPIINKIINLKISGKTMKKLQMKQGMLN